MRFISRLFFPLLAVLMVTACSQNQAEIAKAQPIDPINIQGEGLALHGYDTVAYFTEHKPVAGTKAINYRWHQVTWQFANEKNRKLFVANPTKYAPQFGGYCAYAISRGTIADIDPSSWAIVNDKLYLNNNDFAQSLWEADQANNIRTGEENWAIYPRKPEAK